MRTKFFALLIALSLLLAACSAGVSPNQAVPQTGAENPDASLNLVVTTTIAADVVKTIAGDTANIHVLLPVGVDPHSFEPTPQDLARITEADAVFVVGTGLEDGFLNLLLENAASPESVISLSEGIELRSFQMGETAALEPEEASGRDPHVWFDPNLVITWADNAAAALSDLDADHAADYAANAEAYQQQLTDLDGWIRAQVDTIPTEQRKLVTDHAVLGYFADRYGFEQAGALIPGVSTSAQPTAQELAALEDTIARLGVRAILVGNTVSTELAQRVSDDSGVKLVSFYTDSLSAPGGEAATYLDYMRYNVSAIVSALQ